MTYTQNDMNLGRADTGGTGEVSGVKVDQDNYYLSLKNGKAIKSFTLGNGGYVSTIPVSDADVTSALPFYTGNPWNAYNGYCWPLGDPKTVPVSMCKMSAFNDPQFMGLDPIPVNINERPGCITLTRLLATAPSSIVSSANTDLHCCYINFIDEDGSEGNVIVGPNPSDSGNMMRFLSEQEAANMTDNALLFHAEQKANSAIVMGSNDSLQLLSADTETHYVPGLGSVDQDNYYLQLKSGKDITSYTVNAECFRASLDSSASNPARPFCAMNSGDNAVINDFIWPLGEQQSVEASMFLGAGESANPVEFNSDSFSMSVNEKSGCICLTRLSVVSGMNATEKNDYKAYITYTDSEGNTGQVIVGPNPGDSGNTLQILDWTEVFISIGKMNIEFPEQYDATWALIYANGRNQVPVQLSLSVADSTGVSIPLTAEDIAAVSSLTCDARNNDISKLGWNYSSPKGEFVRVSYDTQMSRGVTANTIYTATNTVYVSCPRRVKSSITIAYTVTINGVQYSTSTYQNNYNVIKLLHIEAMEEKLLQYRGGSEHGGADTDSDFIFEEEYLGKVYDVGNNTPADQYNYYISMRPGDVLTKAKVFGETNRTHPWTGYTRGSTVGNCFVWDLGNPVTTQAWTRNNESYVTGLYYNVKVNQKGPGVLCLTYLGAKYYASSDGDRFNTPSFVELFDDWGNKGSIALLELGSDLNPRIANGNCY